MIGQKTLHLDVGTPTLISKPLAARPCDTFGPFSIGTKVLDSRIGDQVSGSRLWAPSVGTGSGVPILTSIDLGLGARVLSLGPTEAQAPRT